MQLGVKHFEAQFTNRLRMLERSAAIYDSGDYEEASRLANDIVKLVGDRVRKSGLANENFISLSTRLGIKPKEMYDSSLQDLITRIDLHGPICLMAFHVNGANGLVPILDGFKEYDEGTIKKILFDEWWNTSVVRDSKGNEFSRRLIVETMRDQEEAHNDEVLDSEYAELAYKGALGVSQVNTTAISFDMNPARVVVRQIAHEILRTFNEKMQALYVQTKGLMVAPVQLVEVWEVLETGELEQLLDHKGMYFQVENTISPDVWEEWSKFVSAPDIAPALKAELEDDLQYRNRNWQVRIIFANYAPYSIDIKGAYPYMPHPN